MRLCPHCHIEFIYKPYVHDNVTKFHVFSDEQHIVDFMANVYVFKYVAIDEHEHERFRQKLTYAHKGNPTLKGVVNFEKLYDLQSHFKGPTNAKIHGYKLSHEQVILGTNEYIKYVNLVTCVHPKSENMFFRLFKQYRDVLVWTFKDLKVYDT